MVSKDYLQKLGHLLMKGDFLILTDGKLRVGEFPNPNIDFSLTLRKVQRWSFILGEYLVVGGM